LLAQFEVVIRHYSMYVMCSFGHVVKHADDLISCGILNK